MKKKILILGGFGFLGKSLNKALEDDYIIYNESRRTDCDALNLEVLTSKIEKITPDIIIFTSAHVGSINYVSEHAAEVINDNIQMYINLYKAVTEVNKDIIIINPLANCSYPGVINIQNEEYWWDGKIHESVEAYGMSQKTAFIISECYKKQYGIKTINLILPGLYGEGDYFDEERTHAMSGIIMRMIGAQKNNDEEFEVWGTGSPIREWLFVDDVGRIVKEIIDDDKYDLPNPLNLGQEHGISIKDIALKVKELLNYDGNIVYDTTKQDGAPIKILDSKLFNEHFPEFRFTGYEVGINNAINYYKNV